MASPVLFVLTDDASLRSDVLSWPLDGIEPQFYDDVTEALAAARDADAWIFLWDARDKAGSLDGVTRKILSLPSSPELLLISPEEPSPELGVPHDNVQQADPDPGQLREQVLRMIRRQGTRRTSGIVGASPAVRELIATIAQVAPLDVPVLIQGESGTGKELVARALHDNSAHRAQPFVSVNVGSFADSLLESELFGHEKGAFTGAIQQHRGVFERANGGTLFLDEVAEMSLNMQVKLLRVLESSEYIRVGGTQTQRTKVRLITATHRRLEEGIDHGDFRGDLYYRLKVVKIELPPLRDRREDIPMLVNHFLQEVNQRHGLHRKGLTREAMERMMRYAWPGNVRELRNVVNSMAVLAQGDYLGVEDLPAELMENAPAARPLPMSFGDRGGADPLLAQSLMTILHDLRQISGRLDRLERRLGLEDAPRQEWRDDLTSMAEVMPLSPTGQEIPPDLEGAEKAMIQASLRQFGGNRRQAAHQLGISERTLYRKLKRYGIA